ncbi:YrdB family protein [Deinococcus aluminii]|uniref:DUF2568 domain-containing protein n=1 Tax=Deinococcus aluminii TaxID=1656885 RepID=A0ABP9XCX2_9DEIO
MKTNHVHVTPPDALSPAVRQVEQEPQDSSWRTNRLDLLAFGLELAALAALAGWGWQVGRWIPALGAPLAFALVWGALLAPRARVHLPTAAHRVLKLTLFGLVGLAAGQVWGLVPAGVFLGLAALTVLVAPARRVQ